MFLRINKTMSKFHILWIPTNTSLNCSALSTRGSSSKDGSDFSLSGSYESLKGLSFASTSTGYPLERSRTESDSIAGYYRTNSSSRESTKATSASGGFSSSGNAVSSSFGSSWETFDSRTTNPTATDSDADDSGYGSGGMAQSQRRSRWDTFQTNRNSRANSNKTNDFPNALRKRTASVSVEHRGDPSLLNYEKEFIELQRDKSPLKEWNKRFPEGTIVVYTDGSCIDNTASGFGVYFGPDHELNRSERIIGPIHNSALAEILGAQTALRSLRKWKGYKNEPVILRTDFLPLVRAMKESTSYGRFDDDMDEVRRLAMSFPKGVQFEHVYAHDGDPGNEQADALARIATADARRARSVSVPREGFRGNRRGRSLSRNRRWRGRSFSRNRGFGPRRRSRSASWNRNRSRSRNNNREHIRSHSAFVAGRRR
ncbi:hypothetical protein Aduo_015046 [Ancylostoma duodenale]